MRRRLALFILCTIIASGFLIGGVGDVDITAGLQPPSVRHPLGTDVLGRDLLRRILLAASLSLSVSVVAWGIALVVGTAVGAFAAYAEGTLASTVIEDLIAVTFATPFLVVLVALLGVLGPGIGNSYLVLVVFAWAAPARHAATLVRRLRTATHVRAALALGYRPTQITRFVVVPQVFPAVASGALAVLPEILALDVALSFFGQGPQPPTPTFGGLLVDGLTYGPVAWWLVISPLLFLSGICLAMRALRGGNA